MPPSVPGSVVRLADATDTPAIGRLLHDFNVEYDDITPGPDAIARRVGQLITSGDTKVLIAGDDEGLAVLRFRPSIWTSGLECYLAELYVVPARRGNGLGRALMTAAVALARETGADYMDLGTGEDDVAARNLYESLGFINREGLDGPISYVYELDFGTGRATGRDKNSSRTPGTGERIT